MQSCRESRPGSVAPYAMDGDLQYTHTAVIRSLPPPPPHPLQGALRSLAPVTQGIAEFAGDMNLRSNRSKFT